MAKGLIRYITLGSLMALVIACVSFPSENKDPAKNNKTVYNKDLKECKEDYPEQASGVHIRQWINCMKLKGWE